MYVALSGSPLPAVCGLAQGLPLQEPRCKDTNNYRNSQEIHGLFLQPAAESVCIREICVTVPLFRVFLSVPFAG